jgi:hypothetical protein
MQVRDDATAQPNAVHAMALRAHRMARGGLSRQQVQPTTVPVGTCFAVYAIGPAQVRARPFACGAADRRSGSGIYTRRQIGKEQVT